MNTSQFTLLTSARDLLGVLAMLLTLLFATVALSCLFTLGSSSETRRRLPSPGTGPNILVGRKVSVPNSQNLGLVTVANPRRMEDRVHRVGVPAAF